MVVQKREVKKAEGGWKRRVSCRTVGDKNIKSSGVLFGSIGLLIPSDFAGGGTVRWGEIDLD